MRFFSSGQVAELFEVHRDVIQAAFRAGAPEPSMRVANKRIFTEADVWALHHWFENNGCLLKEIWFEPDPNDKTGCAVRLGGIESLPTNKPHRANNYMNSGDYWKPVNAITGDK